MMVSQDCKTDNTPEVSDVTEAAATPYREWDGEWLFNYGKICVTWFSVYMFGYYKTSFTWLMAVLAPLFLILRDTRTKSSNQSKEISILKTKLQEASCQLTEAKENITALELAKRNLETELSDTVKQLTNLNTQLMEKDKKIKNLGSKMFGLESSLKVERVCQTKAVSANKLLQEAQDRYQHEKKVLQDKVTTLEGYVNNSSLAANESACQIAALETKNSILEEMDKKIEDHIPESLSRSTEPVQKLANLNIKLEDQSNSGSESDKLTEEDDLFDSDDLFGSDDEWVPSAEIPKPAPAPTRSTRSTRNTRKSNKKKDDIFNPHLDQENKNKEKLLLINKDKSKSALTPQVLQELNNIANSHINSKNSSSILHFKAEETEECQESDHDVHNSSSKTSKIGAKLGKQKRRLYKCNVDEPIVCEPNMIELPVVSPHSVVRRQLRTKKI